jgi:hypothetical protein
LHAQHTSSIIHQMVELTTSKSEEEEFVSLLYLFALGYTIQ